MKNQSIIISLALILVAFTFTSCDKENLTPTPTGSEVATTQAFEVIDATSDFTITKNTGTTTVIPENFEILINVSTCTTGGYSLTVSSNAVDVANGNYTIVWYKNSEANVYSSGITLECVCGMGVRVEVYDDEGELSASSSLDLSGC